MRKVDTFAPHNDGHQWRKYGEKKINNTNFPRSVRILSENTISIYLSIYLVSFLLRLLLLERERERKENLLHPPRVF